jgi:hypothetical protein
MKLLVDAGHAAPGSTLSRFRQLFSKDIKSMDDLFLHTLQDD